MKISKSLLKIMIAVITAIICIIIIQEDLHVNYFLRWISLIAGVSMAEVEGGSNNVKLTFKALVISREGFVNFALISFVVYFFTSNFFVSILILIYLVAYYTLKRTLYVFCSFGKVKKIIFVLFFSIVILITHSINYQVGALSIPLRVFAPFISLVILSFLLAADSFFNRN